MNKLEKEDAALKREVTGLQVRINIMEQQGGSCNQNVPESSDENLSLKDCMSHRYTCRFNFVELSYQSSYKNS